MQYLDSQIAYFNPKGCANNEENAPFQRSFQHAINRGWNSNMAQRLTNIQYKRALRVRT
jgi:hypothetical protein